MKLIKIVSLILAVLLVGVPTAHATETTSQTRDFLIAAADRAVRQLPTVTDGQSEINHDEIMECARQAQQQVSNQTTRAVSGNVATLDLASIFASADGLSGTRITTVYADALTAYNEADGNDSFRHFTWNFRSAKNIGAYNASLFTTNYEWANILLNTYNSYISERYDHYYNTNYWAIVQGTISTDTLYNMAIADADDYIVALRDSMTTTFESRKADFDGNFDNSNIMDLWNNYYGRSYATSYANLSPADAYSRALSNGVIIQSHTSVTSNQRSTVYTNDWWHT